jgi:hypothetical protein
LVRTRVPLFAQTPVDGIPLLPLEDPLLDARLPPEEPLPAPPDEPLLGESVPLDDPLPADPLPLEEPEVTVPGELAPTDPASGASRGK